jgi:CBS domain-containing protein
MEFLEATRSTPRCMKPFCDRLLVLGYNLSVEPAPITITVILARELKISTPVHLCGESDMHSTDPVARFMTETVLTVDINDGAGEVLRMFTGYPVHHLPVLNQQEVVGMLSTADVMKLDLFLPKGSKSPIDYLNERMKVGQLVRRPVLTVQSQQSVEAAARLMAENGVHALPVVNANNQLLGIISTTDIISAALMANGARPTPGTSGPSVTEPRHMRPNHEHLRQATAAAAAKAGTDADPDFVYESLNYMRARVLMLEEVRHIASRFMQAGQDQTLHSALRKALYAVNRSEELGTAQEAQFEARQMLELV